jgi:c-di-GMP-binding flagellar brake protein YcgR
MQPERRRHRRYRVKDNAFAVIDPEPVKVVPIIDIGMGGLSIYLDDGARGLDTLSKLEIMVADCSFYLEKVPFQIVAKSGAFSNHNANLMNGRRCGIRFGNLRPVQKSHLKYFIRRYTEKGSFSQVISSFSRLLDPIRAPKPSIQSCNNRVWQSLHRSSP